MRGDAHVVRFGTDNWRLLRGLNKYKCLFPVSVNNCVRFYATADEIDARRLKEHCSHLISSNWEQFNFKDFESLSAQLVYDMLKVSYPREDDLEYFSN